MEVGETTIALHREHYWSAQRALLVGVTITTDQRADQ